MQIQPIRAEAESPRENRGRSTGREEPAGEAEIAVWDRFLRQFHWGFGLAVALALLTSGQPGQPWIGIHVAAGVTALGLVVLRLLWGLFGPGAARFSAFVILSPKALAEHLHALRVNRAPRFISHNPLGALMVLALLGTILALAPTGTLALGGLYRIGPAAAFLPARWGEIAAALHALLGNGIMILIAAHLAGVIFESRRHRENLARAMITGRKPRRAGDVMPPARRARPILTALLGAALLGAGAWGAVTLSQARPRGLPVAPADFDPAFAEECSACHMLYNPALLPASDWKRLMATLPDHFGEDASLDPATTARITAFLTAHSAETADIRASRSFRLRGGGRKGGPASLEENPAWRAYHEDLPPALFKSGAVLSAANCAACHKDAEAGIFSPFAIEIPKHADTKE